MHLTNNRIKNLYWEVYNRKFDYYYLKTILLGKTDSTNGTIYAGSSYSIFGVIPGKDDVCVGLPSQDFYYSDKLIRKVVSKRLFKRVIFIIGYYTPFCDLSKTCNIFEQLKIDDVYLPLFNDCHNRNIQEYRNLIKTQKGLKGKIKEIFTGLCALQQKVKYFNRPIFSYFNKLHSREIRKRVTWNDPRLSWTQLNESERSIAGRIRAQGHEKFLKYVASYDENLRIYQDLFIFLHMNNIEFDVVCAPFSDEYLEGMSATYVNNAIFIMNQLRESCDNFVDLNNLAINDETVKFYNEFSLIDFVDADHLSDNGAKKLTNILHNLFI